MEELDLKEVKPVAAPAVRDGGPAVRESQDSLGPEEAAMFARCTGKLVYFSADRLESAFVVRLLAQDLKAPTRLSLMRLKHLAKFLKGTRSWCWCYKFQEECHVLVGFGDSDWATCPKTRRSVSCGCIFRGAHYLDG